jgi:hypothetical protein
MLAGERADGRANNKRPQPEILTPVPPYRHGVSGFDRWAGGVLAGVLCFCWVGGVWADPFLFVSFSRSGGLCVEAGPAGNLHSARVGTGLFRFRYSDFGFGGSAAPRVSLVIPSFNEEAVLRQMIPSVPALD